MKYFVQFLVTLLISFIANTATLESDCENEVFIVCSGSRMIHGLMDKLNQVQEPLVIFPGLEIVLTNDTKDIDTRNNSLDESLIRKITTYFQHHEVNIRFSELMYTTGVLGIMSDEIEKNQPVAEARKKDGKMYLVALSLMFVKILTIFGIGSLGALAMKALSMASIALLLTTIVGLKGLHQSSEETSHHVQYISDGHHRRRKRFTVDKYEPTLPLAYQLKKIQK